MRLAALVLLLFALVGCGLDEDAIAEVNEGHDWGESCEGYAAALRSFPPTARSSNRLALYYQEQVTWCRAEGYLGAPGGNSGEGEDA